MSEHDQKQLWQESAFLGRQLMTLYAGEKLNVAALGNVVNQLHVHHVVRFEGDIAWPAPVWGKHPAIPYAGEELEKLIELLAEIIEKCWV